MVSAEDLHGMHVALATPVDGEGRLDRGGMARLLDRVVAGGVDAVCPTGSTGEGPRFTRSQRRTVTETVRAHLGPGRLIVSAASALSADDAVAEIAGLARAGADAALLAPPSYYPMAAGEVTRWYAGVAAAADLPLVLYNIPSMTTVPLPATAVGELATLPGVIGIKDSSRDLEYLQSVVYATTAADFAVLTGSDTLLLASLQVGAVGTIAASANLVPELGRAVYDAVRTGDLAAAATAQERLFTIVQACRMGIPPAGWKAALAWAGVCSPDPVPPAQRLSDEQRAALAEQLTRLIPR